MAKNANVVPLKEEGLPPALAGRMSQDAGKGASRAQEDNLVPLVYILQAQSPQVNKRGAEHIEGAEPGSIWLRNHPHPIVDGEEGILFQPCYFTKDWVEWVPRSKGGGYAGRHPNRPAEAEEKPDPENPNKNRWMLPNGNEVRETRYHIGLVHLPSGKVPYVIPMSSSGHTVSRQWMFMMNSKQIPGQNGSAPTWACLYRLRTKERTNAAGTWFTWDVSDAGWVQTEEDYDAGRDLNAAFETGAKVVDEPEVSAEQQPAGDDAAM